MEPAGTSHFWIQDAFPRARPQLFATRRRHRSTKTARFRCSFLSASWKASGELHSPTLNLLTPNTQNRCPAPFSSQPAPPFFCEGEVFLGRRSRLVRQPQLVAPLTGRNWVSAPKDKQNCTAEKVVLKRMQLFSHPSLFLPAYLGCAPLGFDSSRHPPSSASPSSTFPAEATAITHEDRTNYPFFRSPHYCAYLRDGRKHPPPAFASRDPLITPRLHPHGLQLRREVWSQ